MAPRSGTSKGAMNKTYTKPISARTLPGTKKSKNPIGGKPKFVTTPATNRFVEEPMPVVIPPKIEAKLSGIKKRLTGIPMRSVNALMIGMKMTTTGVLLRTLETTATGIRLITRPRRALPPLR